MDKLEKRRTSLIDERNKVEEKIVSLKNKSAELAKQLEDIDNQRIVTAVKNSGVSFDELVKSITNLKESKDSKSDADNISASETESERKEETQNEEKRF